jgi:hypothetical protein
VQELLDGKDLPVAVDPAIVRAAAPLDPPFNDVSRLKSYTWMVEFPPGFVGLDPGQQDSSLTLRVISTDVDGNSAIVDRTIVVMPDTDPPKVDLLQPALGAPVTEGTLAHLQVAAHDNAFVDRIEIVAGRDKANLHPVYTARNFPPRNAVPGSTYGTYAPFVDYDLTVPLLGEGEAGGAPYFVGAYAIDVNGNQSDPITIGFVTVVRDQGPSAHIVSPSEETRAVENTLLTVVVGAEDDVGIGAVELSVDNTTIKPTLYSPPFIFQYQVPPATPGRTLKLEAKAVDTFGHGVPSQTVTVPVVADAPPTVAIARPQPTDKLVEGQELAFLVAADDDASVKTVEAQVEGGVNGPLRFVGTAYPYAFKVSLPYGSAGRTLTFSASATDSAGQTRKAQSVSVPVLVDTHPPDLLFLSPQNGSHVKDGLKLDVDVQATDNVAVANVALTDPDKPAPYNMPAPPYRFAYQVPHGSVGKTLVFDAVATDTSGNKKSASVSVEVDPDDPPSVSVNPPARIVGGIPVELGATATDDVAVARVSFYVGMGQAEPTLVAERYLLPYQAMYTADRSLIGKTLILRAKATDVAGQEKWSAPVSIEVEADKPPQIEIVSPKRDAVRSDRCRGPGQRHLLARRPEPRHRIQARRNPRPPQ